MSQRFPAFLLCALLWFGGDSSAFAEQWSIPLAGNSYRANRDGGGRDGVSNAIRLSDERDVYRVYFHVDRTARCQLAVTGTSDRGAAEIAAEVGESTLTTNLTSGTAPSGNAAMKTLGTVTFEKPGYVQVTLTHSKGDPATLTELVVTSDQEDLHLDFVRNNEGGMFYWGRRGPSVHLSYRTPQDKDLTYAYNEITVPEGQDTVGSYFMSNGFSEGYFGIQVNSESERRVLFSVWSPFRTDNPAEIPESDRVATLAKGDRVRAQDFGNEGSGGQSYLIYPWKSGQTYCFLTEVKPDGKGNTRYTSWFRPKSDPKWRLMASFRRPKTDKHLTGFHSFLENFVPDTGDITRSAHYGNQWVRDTEGQWHEVTTARFTGDNTARGRHRLDFAGGSSGDVFFLRNCGFFAPHVELDQTFERRSTASDRPQIDFSKLPR